LIVARCPRCALLALLSFPTRRSSDLDLFLPTQKDIGLPLAPMGTLSSCLRCPRAFQITRSIDILATESSPKWLHSSYLSKLSSRSEEHTSELQSRFDLVCRLMLENKN